MSCRVSGFTTSTTRRVGSICPTNNKENSSNQEYITKENSPFCRFQVYYVTVPFPMESRFRMTARRSALQQSSLSGGDSRVLRLSAKLISQHCNRQPRGMWYAVVLQSFILYCISRASNSFAGDILYTMYTYNVGRVRQQLFCIWQLHKLREKNGKEENRQRERRKIIPWWLFHDGFTHKIKRQTPFSILWMRKYWNSEYTMKEFDILWLFGNNVERE